MADENKKVEVVEEIDYVAEINKIKANSVPKEQYISKVEENKKLMSALVENRQIENPEPQPTRKELSERVRKLATDGGTNLQVVDTILKLRAKIIEEDGVASYVPDELAKKDPEFDNRVAGQLQEIVDACNGDNRLFTGFYDKFVKESVNQKQWQLISNRK